MTKAMDPVRAPGRRIPEVFGARPMATAEDVGAAVFAEGHADPVDGFARREAGDQLGERGQRAGVPVLVGFWHAPCVHSMCGV
jgi:hypothetical protein